MQTKYILTLLFTGSLYYATSAQFIFSARKPIETYKESIDKYENSQLKDPIPFSYIHIIDSRYDTTGIGFFLAGRLSLRDSNQLLGLQHTINKYYSPLYTANKDTLVVQIEKLSIQDAIIRDTNFVLTEGSVVCKEYAGGSDRYRYLCLADTTIQEKFSYAYTYKANRNGKHINVEFWDYYLLRLFEAMIRKAGPAANYSADTTQYVSIETIRGEGFQKRNKPILTEGGFKPGFYRNLSEFENNDPGVVPVSDSALHNQLEIMHYRVGKSVSDYAPDTSYWGFCDGKKIFIRYRYDFFELEKRDAAFYIAPTLDAKRRDLNHTGWNMLLGLAELATGIATKEGVHLEGFSTMPAPDIPIVLLSLHENRILGLQLDWDTGQITY